MNRNDQKQNPEDILQLFLVMALLLVLKIRTDGEPQCIPRIFVTWKQALRIVKVGHEEENRERNEGKLQNQAALLIPKSLKDRIDKKCILQTSQIVANESEQVRLGLVGLDSLQG